MKEHSQAKANLESPARNAYAITAHDSNEVGTHLPRMLYVGGAGNITMRLIGDETDVVFNGVAAGTTLNVRPRLIKATGTTATGLVGLY